MIGLAEMSTRAFGIYPEKKFKKTEECGSALIGTIIFTFASAACNSAPPDERLPGGHHRELEDIGAKRQGRHRVVGERSAADVALVSL